MKELYVMDSESTSMLGATVADRLSRRAAELDDAAVICVPREMQLAFNACRLPPAENVRPFDEYYDNEFCEGIFGDYSGKMIAEKLRELNLKGYKGKPVMPLDYNENSLFEHSRITPFALLPYTEELMALLDAYIAITGVSETSKDKTRIALICFCAALKTARDDNRNIYRVRYEKVYNEGIAY